MRAVGRSLLAVILAGFAAVAGCEPPPPSPGPSAPASPPSSAPAPASIDLPLPGPILGAWRAEPVPVPPALAPRIDQACRANLGPDFPAGAVIALVDARGEGVLQAFFASPTGGWASCTPLFVDPLGEVSGERGHAVSPGSLDDLDALELELVDFTWSGEPPAPITASYLAGREGAGVARVEIQSPGRPSILASRANGWWAAWTPGPMPARWQIVGLDALGVVVNAIDGVPQVGG